jgi:hypothetical protein
LGLKRNPGGQLEEVGSARIGDDGSGHDQIPLQGNGRLAWKFAKFAIVE